MPTSSKPILVTLSGTGTFGGQVARVMNRTTGEVHPTATFFSVDKHLNFDCAEFIQGYTLTPVADVIEVSTNGPAYGTVLITLSGIKSQKATLSATAESTTLPQGGT